MKTVADLQHRRLQSLVIGIVLFLAAGAATLALGVLVESHEPFQRAFAAANGAHLVVEFDGAIPADQVAATRTATGVTAAAGPWQVAPGALGHPKGGQIPGTFSGRPQPDASIDAVTMIAGRWWQAPGEVVLDQDVATHLERSVGQTIDVYASPNFGKGGGPAPGDPTQGSTPVETLMIVGIAGSVSTPDVAGWASPADIAKIGGSQVLPQEMLYRVSPAATAGDLAAALNTITQGMPANAVLTASNYLATQTSVNRLADLYVPVLLAFSIFALLAAAFTIANVVGGIVLTSFREIGVMKAIGFTPAQVSWSLVAQVVLPAVLGTVAGVVAGTIASAPIIQQTAQSFGLPAGFTLSVPVVVAVLGIAIGTAIVAAIGPATQAGRLSVVGAISRGLAPSARPDGGRLRRLGLRLPAGLSIRLGVAAGVSHPARAAMTLGAVMVGVVAVTFSLGLNASLLRAREGLQRPTSAPVRLDLADAESRFVGATTSPSNGDPTPAAITAAITANADTGRVETIGQTEVSVPRLGTVPFVGYQGDSSWLGYDLIAGRWFAGAGEAVAPTNLFAQSGLHLGDTVTVSQDGRSVAITLVGEIFDQARENDDNLVLRGAWDDLAALQPGIEPSRWEMQPRAGVEPRTYRGELQSAIPGLPISLESDASSDASFVLFLTVVGVLGAVLVAISLGGVFNTILLETRQRTREIAVLKAIGFTPTGVVAMVAASILPVGIVAGLVGVPIGIAAQGAVLRYMGMVAAKTAIPPVMLDVFSPALLAGLALTGLAIGLVGAYLPAQRAARARIAPVLQAE
ncbi:MAG TPA: FtsX-like permease family protein [Candidatus Limnocylindrales bacterium]